MKIPKIVMIAGRPYRVDTNVKGLLGADFTTNPGLIRLGEHKSKEEKEIWLLHEILEALLVVRDCRYEGYPGEYLMVLKHKDFNGIVRDFYAALRPMLKDD